MVKFENGKYTGSFTQHFSILAENNTTIEAFKLKFLDKQTDTIKEIVTKAIVVEVVQPKDKIENKLITSTPITTKTKVVKVNNKLYLFSMLVIGLILGFIISFLMFFKKAKKQEMSTIHESIQKAKSDKELLNLLLPYSNNEKIAIILQQLEENVYDGKRNKKPIRF